MKGLMQLLEEIPDLDAIVVVREIESNQTLNPEATRATYMCCEDKGCHLTTMTQSTSAYLQSHPIAPSSHEKMIHYPKSSI